MTEPPDPEDLRGQSDVQSPDRSRRAADVLEKQAKVTTAGVEWMRRVTYGVMALAATTLLVALGTGIATAIVLHEFDVEDAEDERRSQAGRVTALVDVCEAVNRTNRGVRAFVVERDPDSATRIASLFPIEPDCRAYAQRIVFAPAPPAPAR